MSNKGVRINKYLSEIGYCSRREADTLIEQERVWINGKVPNRSTQVSITDEIIIDSEMVQKPSKAKKEDFVYLALNKPKGVVCTTDTTEANNIIDFVGFKKRIFPIGRLDKLSEGLILMTNDGDIVNKVLRAGNKHDKEYIVETQDPITDAFIKKMSNGVRLGTTYTQKCEVTQLGKNKFKIILTQGLNRQIRRMTEACGNKVTSLKRTRIMNIQLDVPVGNYRFLSKDELNKLMKLVKHSKKTA